MRVKLDLKIKDFWDIRLFFFSFFIELKTIDYENKEKVNR